MREKWVGPLGNYWIERKFDWFGVQGSRSATTRVSFVLMIWVHASYPTRGKVNNEVAKESPNEEIEKSLCGVKLVMMCI